MRPPKLLALLQAHDIARYRESDGVGKCFGKSCSLAWRPSLWTSRQLIVGRFVIHLKSNRREKLWTIKFCLASIVASYLVLDSFIENIRSNSHKTGNHNSLWSSGSRLDFLSAPKGSKPFPCWHPFGCWLGLGSTSICLVLQVWFYPIPDSCCLWSRFVINSQFEIVPYIVFTNVHKIYQFLHMIHSFVDARELKRERGPT